MGVPGVGPWVGRAGGPAGLRLAAGPGPARRGLDCDAPSRGAGGRCGAGSESC